MNEQIAIIQPENSFRTWEPQNMGDEILALLRHKDQNNNLTNSDGTPTAAGIQIINETTRILELCGDPTESTFHETGLVIGYVQSGKTLSFTALTAMARDNDYQLIIVIAGTSKPLSQQTTDRLQKDLRLPRNDRRWVLLANPKGADQRNEISSILNQWRDPLYPRNECQTLIITVMKNGSHLKNLDELLQSINLEGVSTLIIDDEGDQASLNTKAKRAADDDIPLTDAQVSTIYDRITELRSRLPHHTFLQYTATPQAPLFINILDRLSPNFIKLLTPGDSYTGGKKFFIENPRLVKVIPNHDIESEENHLASIPSSLLEALRIFFIGVAVGYYRKDNRGKNRTMMIHPSRTTGQHSNYQHWVNDTVNSWIRLLDEQDGNSDKEDFLNEFRVAYNKLRETVIDVVAFEELLTGHHLNRALRYTQRRVINAKTGKTPEIPWSTHYSFILIGGQALDRGFTVEGLTVTYMPRNLGTGNVDTVLQRARFFGYKGSYLQYCRLYLPEEAINAYRKIIEHEEDVRNRLHEFNIDNRHLNNWDRQTVMNAMLNLTRRNVLYDDVVRNIVRGDQWIYMKSPQDTENLIKANYQVLMKFLIDNQKHFTIDAGDDQRTEIQKNLRATFLIKDILNPFLDQLKFTRASDSTDFTLIRGLLTNLSEEDPELTCYVYLMATTNIHNWPPRERELDKGQINQLFQGANARTGYPGAREIRVPNAINIQVHLLKFKGTDFSNVPTIAVRLPASVEAHIIQQPTNQRGFIRTV